MNTDLGNVIKGLECKLNAHYDTCKNCPYFSEELAEDYPEFEYFCNRSQIEADALELLKAAYPESHCLTLEELRKVEPGTVLWKTQKSQIPPFPVEFKGFGKRLYIDEDGKQFILNTIEFALGAEQIEEYGKTIALWAAKPNDEQYKAMKWDDCKNDS